MLYWMMVMTFHILALFPEQIECFFKSSIIFRAIKNGKINIKYWQLRDFANDKHKTVDDKTDGGQDDENAHNQQGVPGNGKHLSHCMLSFRLNSGPHIVAGPEGYIRTHLNRGFIFRIPSKISSSSLFLR